MRGQFVSSLLLCAGVAAGAAVPADSESISRREEETPVGRHCLDPRLIQSASQVTGQEPGTNGLKAGQSPSATDEANFINFCKGKTITNGNQNTNGSCNSIPMGNIPAKTNMISSIILYPQPGDIVVAHQTFTVSIQTSHLRAGYLVNPGAVYYTAPQDLDENGDIIGHSHITIQNIGELRTTKVPDPSTFAYFKGLDDAGNGKGLLSTTVDGGLAPGWYRVCSMIAARNHQPVVMPVAQRGAQDDCTKFEVAYAPGHQGGKRCEKN